MTDPDKPQPLRYRIDFALMGGREATPAELARDLGVSGAHMRRELHRMRDAGEIGTRGDGWYFATDATRRQLNAPRCATARWRDQSRPSWNATWTISAARVSARPRSRSADGYSPASRSGSPPKGARSSTRHPSSSKRSPTSRAGRAADVSR